MMVDVIYTVCRTWTLAPLAHLGEKKKEKRRRAPWGRVRTRNEKKIITIYTIILFLILKSKTKTTAPRDSRVVPHRGTNRAALWLTAQIGRDAVLSESYGRGCR